MLLFVTSLLVASVGLVTPLGVLGSWLLVIVMVVGILLLVVVWGRVLLKLLRWVLMELRLVIVELSMGTRSVATATSPYKRMIPIVAMILFGG